MRIARVALWTGAVVDALAALQLLLPESFAVGGFTGLRVSGPAGQVALESAALLLGWSAIEIWAAGDPVARRPVLFIGASVAVVFLAQNAWLLGSGQVGSASTLPILILQAVLVLLWTAAIWSVARSSTHT